VNPTRKRDHKEAGVEVETGKEGIVAVLVEVEIEKDQEVEVEIEEDLEAEIKEDLEAEKESTEIEVKAGMEDLEEVAVGTDVIEVGVMEEIEEIEAEAEEEEIEVEKEEGEAKVGAEIETGAQKCQASPIKEEHLKTCQDITMNLIQQQMMKHHTTSLQIHSVKLTVRVVLHHKPWFIT